MATGSPWTMFQILAALYLPASGENGTCWAWSKCWSPTQGVSFSCQLRHDLGGRSRSSALVSFSPPPLTSAVLLAGGSALWPVKVDVCESSDPAQQHKCFNEDNLCFTGNNRAQWCQNGKDVKAASA